MLPRSVLPTSGSSCTGLQIPAISAPPLQLAHALLKVRPGGPLWQSRRQVRIEKLLFGFVYWVAVLVKVADGKRPLHEMKKHTEVGAV